jgi:hypothetical protein
MVDAARAALDARRRAAPPPFVVAAAAPVASPPATLGRGRRGGRWTRRWPALLTVAATLLLLTAVAVGSLRGSPAPAPAHSPQTGLVPPNVFSPLPLIGTTSTPSPASPSATPHSATTNHAVVVTVNASPSPSAAARPTAGPPSPTAAGPPSPAPTTAPAPGATPWPASPPTNTTSGCEPNWSWSCVKPLGRCHNVAHYNNSEQILGDRLISVTVGTDGSLCARWSNAAVQGALLDSSGNTVGGVSGANAGFTVYGLTPGATYRVALHYTDGPSGLTSLQINYA